MEADFISQNPIMRKLENICKVPYLKYTNPSLQLIKMCHANTKTSPEFELLLTTTSAKPDDYITNGNGHKQILCDGIGNWIDFPQRVLPLFKRHQRNRCRINRIQIASRLNTHPTRRYRITFRIAFSVRFRFFFFFFACCIFVDSRSLSRCKNTNITAS